jgi:hypothetical protein
LFRRTLGYEESKAQSSLKVVIDYSTVFAAGGAITFAQSIGGISNLGALFKHVTY